jgi:anaerobic selenocysteine-containing dehydrogenase
VVTRVRGDKAQSYTAGVICAKVARYSERLYHPDRLLYPLIRTGEKGEGAFRRASWEEALDLITETFLTIENVFGAEAIWPYYYAGTMGLVMRDGINRLRHVKKYSGFFSTICVNMAWAGYIAGTGKLMGVDPREMAKADCVVIWGTNAVATQVNVITHATKARKDRKAKIVVIDTYMTDTMKQADLALMLKPGTDAALACAVMHILFRDNLADRDYMHEFADDPAGLEAHLSEKTPEWASRITGLHVDEIEVFAKLVGNTPKTYFRLGYGFSRQKNGAVNMHAASCIATVLGAWKHEGGGAFHNNGGIYHWNKTLIEGSDKKDTSVRMLDQSRIGAILTQDQSVKALLIQNTNPVNVAPNQSLVVEGFKRNDLFTVVHEQFMTDTAKYADVVLPATMFLEHDDLYQSGGNQHIQLGLKVVEPMGETMSNHDLIAVLASRLGAQHSGFALSPRQIIDVTLRVSKHGTLAELEANNFKDVQPDFNTSHYTEGFAWGDKRFKFKPDWANTPFANIGLMGNHADMPVFPDYWAVNEHDEAFKLVTAPARSFLNSTFAETQSSVKREGRPSVIIHPDDAGEIATGDLVTLSNKRGSVSLHAIVEAVSHKGVLIAEGLWANSAHVGGCGINVLVDDAPVAPFGGAAFHDVSVRLTKA